MRNIKEDLKGFFVKELPGIRSVINDGGWRDGEYDFLPPNPLQEAQYFEALKACHNGAGAEHVIRNMAKLFGVENADKLHLLDLEEAAFNRSDTLGYCIQAGRLRLRNNHAHPFAG